MTQTILKKSKIDDGFYPELTEGANLLGYMGIPELMDLKNTEIPRALVPFSQAAYQLKKGNTRAYVHFYEHDKRFSEIITDIDKHIDVLSHFDGVITPDCTMLDNQANCLQATNTYFNRAIGYRLQKAGIPVICNIRWSDANSFDYCFLGAHKSDIVSIGTYGTIKSRQSKIDFRLGLEKMIDALEPKDVLVYGGMPKFIFAGLENATRFHQYEDWSKLMHMRGGN